MWGAGRGDLKFKPAAGDTEDGVRARPASCMEPQVGVVCHFVGQLVVLQVVAPYQHLQINYSEKKKYRSRDS